MRRFLSIDWDYFIGASADERAMLFPDGGNENLPEYVKEFIWDSRYVHPNIKRIKVISEISFVRDVVQKSLFHKSMIVDSHRYIYDFVREVITDPKESFEIVNVDFHHDCYNFSIVNVDCGNWVLKLKEIYPNMRCTWVCRKDSDVDAPYVDEYSFDIVHELDRNPSFTHAFLCRSSMWSPPHLDSKFISLARQIEKRSVRTVYEDGIYTPRKYCIEELPAKVRETLAVKTTMGENYEH